MNTIKHILQTYEASLDDKIDYLVEAGLFEEKKVGMLKRAVNKNPNNLTMAESKVLKEFVDNVVSQLLYEKQDHLSAYDKKMNKNKNVDKELPTVIILKRKAIRVYPDNQKIALYYSQALDRYISIPYGPKGEALGMTMNESIDPKVNPQDSNKIPSANPKSPSEREMKKDVDTGDILKMMKKNEPVNPRMNFAPSADPKMRIDEVTRGVGGGNVQGSVLKRIEQRKKEQNTTDLRSLVKVRTPSGVSLSTSTQKRELPNAFKELRAGKTPENIRKEIEGLKLPPGHEAAAKAGLLVRQGIEGVKGLGMSALKGAVKKMGMREETSFRKHLSVIREERIDEGETWDKVKDVAKSMVPGVDAYKAYKEGRYLDAAGNIALDAATIGAGIATGGVGAAAIRGAAAGAKALKAGKNVRKSARIAQAVAKRSKGWKAARAIGRGAKGIAKGVAGVASAASTDLDLDKLWKSTDPQGIKFGQVPVKVGGPGQTALGMPASALELQKQKWSGNPNPGGLGYQQESNLSLIKNLSKSKSLTEQSLTFGENSVTINKGTAKKVMKVYNSLNESNKKKMENMLSESASSFKKAIQFAVRH